jgi:hypothetical protein
MFDLLCNVARVDERDLLVLKELEQGRFAVVRYGNGFLELVKRLKLFSGVPVKTFVGPNDVALMEEARKQGAEVVVANDLDDFCEAFCDHFYFRASTTGSLFSYLENFSLGAQQGNIFRAETKDLASRVLNKPLDFGIDFHFDGAFEEAPFYTRHPWLFTSSKDFVRYCQTGQRRRKIYAFQNITCMDVVFVNANRVGMVELKVSHDYSDRRRGNVLYKMRKQLNLAHTFIKVNFPDYHCDCVGVHMIVKTGDVYVDRFEENPDTRCLELVA